MCAWKTLGALAAAIGLAHSGAALADGYSGPARYAQPYNWSGVYVGINAGEMSGDISGSLPTAPGFPFNVDLGSRFVFGGHIGYQHQIGNFVLGVEGGYTDTGNRWSSNPAGPDCANVFPCQARMDGIWQVGGRLGYAVDRWMVYGTGGFAATDVGTRSAPGIEVASATHNGWFIGGGTEFALTKNLILGVEYLHYDFNAQAQNTDPATNPGGVCPLFCVRRIDPDTDIVRARLSVKFGRDEDYRPLRFRSRDGVGCRCRSGSGRAPDNRLTRIVSSAFWAA